MEQRGVSPIGLLLDLHNSSCSAQPALSRLRVSSNVDVGLMISCLLSIDEPLLGGDGFGSY